jgi:hypothetical protein
MSEVLEMPWDELVERVHDDAAGGNERAARVLRLLLEHEAAGGDTNCVITRLHCKPHIGAPKGEGGSAKGPTSTRHPAVTPSPSARWGMVRDAR